jgi:hypothetical protein
MLTVLERRTYQTLLATLLILVSGLVFIGVQHSFYLYLLVIGSVFSLLTLRNFKEIGFVFHVLTGFLWGAGLVILFSSFLSMVNILIQPWILILPVSLNLLLIFFLPADYQKIKFKLSLEDFVLGAFLTISLLSHVISIKGFTTPILHDPVSHATWAKQIYETGRIDYFYSPGLHILAAFGMFVDRVNVATYILRLTNIFAAMLFIPVYYFLKVQYGSIKIALLGSASFLLGAFPTNFFLIAGKNALVVALPFLPLLLFLIRKIENKNTAISLSNGLIFILVITHYPFAAISLIVVGSHIIFEKGFNKIVRVFPGILMGLLWGFAKLPYRIQEVSTKISPQQSSINLSFDQISKLIKSSFVQSYMYFQQPRDKYLFYCGLVALAFILLVAFREKKFRGFIASVIGSLCLIIVINSIPILQQTIHLVYSTQLITFSGFVYVAIAICIGFGLDLLSKNKEIRWINSLLTIGLVFAISIHSYSVYRTYKDNQTSKNLVSSNDLNAYSWIKENIPSDELILINAAQNNRKTIVYGSDGGLWIPVYTQNSVTMPFTEFSDQKTHFFYDEYEKLIQGGATCSVFDNLLIHGASYYYMDSSGVYGSQLDPNDYPDNLIQVYNQDGIRIFKFIGCN